MRGLFGAGGLTPLAPPPPSLSTPAHSLQLGGGNQQEPRASRVRAARGLSPPLGAWRGRRRLAWPGSALPRHSRHPSFPHTHTRAVRHTHVHRAMFFHILMEKDLHIYPRHFGPRLKQHLQDELVRKVEGTCSGRYGFIITVTQVLGFESDDEFHSQVPPPHPTPPHPTPPYTTLHHPTRPYTTLHHPTPPYPTLPHPVPFADPRTYQGGDGLCHVPTAVPGDRLPSLQGGGPRRHRHARQ